MSEKKGQSEITCFLVAAEKAFLEFEAAEVEVDAKACNRGIGSGST